MRLVELVGLRSMQRRRQRNAQRAILYCPDLGALDHLGADSPAARIFIDHYCREPGVGLARVQGVEEMNTDAPDHASILFGYDHRRSRPRGHSVQPLGNLGCFTRIPQLTEQPTERRRVVLPCRSDFKRRHEASIQSPGTPHKARMAASGTSSFPAIYVRVRISPAS